MLSAKMLFTLVVNAITSGSTKDKDYSNEAIEQAQAVLERLPGRYEELKSNSALLLPIATSFITNLSKGVENDTGISTLSVRMLGVLLDENLPSSLPWRTAFNSVKNTKAWELMIDDIQGFVKKKFVTAKEKKDTLSFKANKHVQPRRPKDIKNNEIDSEDVNTDFNSSSRIL